jgi:addiction module RelE/StbE family toxin
MRIRWTTDAASDLERIAAYILRENPSAARNVIRTVTDGIATLARFPNRGRSGHVDDTRELLFPSLPYIAVYSVKKQVIEVLRIYHAAQDWP